MATVVLCRKFTLDQNRDMVTHAQLITVATSGVQSPDPVRGLRLHVNDPLEHRCSDVAAASKSVHLNGLLSELITFNREDYGACDIGQSMSAITNLLFNTIQTVNAFQWYNLHYEVLVLSR